MHKKEDSVHQPDQTVSTSPKWLKKLTMILASVLLLTMFGLGGYLVGARQRQSLSENLLSKPRPSWSPTATPVQQRSASPTTSQADQMAGWKIYLSRDSIYQFRYPSNDYNVHHDNELDFSKKNKTRIRDNFIQYIGYNPPELATAIFLLPRTTPDDASRLLLAPFAFWIFNNPEELSIDDWYKRYWYYPFLWG